MLDKYLITVEKDGAFLAGYHQSYAKGAERVYLSQHFRLVRLVSGEARWEIGGRAYEVKQGDILVFNNITPRQIVHVGDAPLVYELVGFSASVFSLDTYYIGLFYAQAPRHPVLKAAWTETEEIHGLFDLLKKKMHESEPHTPVITGLIGVICTMIDECFRSRIQEAEAAPSPTGDACRTVGMALRYIRQNLCEIRDVAEVAEGVHISRGYFHKIFTRYTGYTPGDYINHLRIVHFISLLSTKSMTVLEAAMACGFTSASGFYKTFHAVCGMSPKEYLSHKE